MIDLKKYKVEKNKPLVGLEDLSLKASTEGIVLLKNDNNLLPLKDKEISVFGRIQFDYYKSGTGSGGLVNVLDVPSITECLLENPLITLNKDVLDYYEEWVTENPYNAGNGQWASEPWCQTEMTLPEDLVKNSTKSSDTAVVVIGRTAGEDRDNYMGKGSYLLSDEEEAMLSIVSKYYKKIAVVLNVGNVIDMTFVDKYNITSVMYAWHGGGLGARGIASALTGLVTPSGKLVDTIAKDVQDYPSTKNFGDNVKNIYAEDIYVGYRYFNTFNTDAIRYPFGFGLSYTKFETTLVNVKQQDLNVVIEVKVKNIGNTFGKEVVQIYCNPACGNLGRPKTELVAFAKTKELKVSEEQTITLTVNMNNIATYDDCGASGNKNCSVLEAGEYVFNIGLDSLNLKEVLTVNLDKTIVVKKHLEACSPKESFKRLTAKVVNGKYVESYEDTPTRTYDLEARYEETAPKLIKLNDNKYTLEDVYNKKCTMDEFIGSLTDLELSEIVRGEGMSSPKVTSGTASAFGGVTQKLLDRKVPIMCCADGPSGIRMDSGQLATSLPNGTMLACTFNFDLVSDLYAVLGVELRNYNVDVLLGPGMNIHRHPLNGRNFEYFSEDPLVTGIMATAYTYGLQRSGAFGTLKHLACNSQETARFDADSILSERALRDIYIKGFEIAIKMGDSKAIMTSYNPINGIWGAGQHDINYQIVRRDWGFDGVIVTDWWAKMNDDNGEGTKANTKAMIRSTNDVYMVVGDSVSNANNDNTIESLENKSLNKAYLQLCAKNICNFALNTKAFYRNIDKELANKYYKLNNWYEVSGNDSSETLLSKVEINGKDFKEFNPLVNSYNIPYEITSLKTDKDAVIKNNKNSYVVSIDNNVYYFNSNKTAKVSKLIDLEKCVNKEVFNVENKPWVACNININNFSYKTDKIVINEFIDNCLEKEYISFPLQINGDGKYVFVMKISCETSQLAQVPFSLFIDYENRSTITTGATNGNIIDVNSHLILSEGLHQFTIRFNKSGVKIKEIIVMRHG